MMGRERLPHFLFIFLGLSSAVIFQVHAQDQSGFISIDCGTPSNTSYSDTTTGINYVSDASFIETGVTKTVASDFNTAGVDRQLLNVRSFPEGNKNCYNVSLSKDTKYLIRTSFMYGDYDGLNELPEFDLYIGASKWDTVKIMNSSVRLIKELIHIPAVKFIYVCLVNTGSGTPFISALEFRTLPNNTYVTKSGSLTWFTRLNMGSTTNLTVRYPDDVHDRLWYPNHYYLWTDISTTDTIDSQSHNYYQPPSTVMQTACIPTNETGPLEFFIDTSNTTLQFYVYMHFAEIVKLQSNESRMFNITLNENNWYGNLIPDYLYTTTLFSPSILPGEGKYRFSMFKTGNATLPPLLNAIEIYSVVDLTKPLTKQLDVNAIMNIKSTYAIKRDWQGDPCAPQDYAWEGLDCSYSDNTSPIIISLNLSSSELTGKIAPAIANLKSLESLDLSNNSLEGEVPDFLTQLPSLKILNLTGNNLTGVVPAELLERSRTGSLSLSLDGNLELCPSGKCTKKKKKPVVPIVASVAAVFVLASVLGILLWSLKRRKKHVGTVETGKNNSSKSNRPDLLESKQMQFTYAEVLKMTNNFEKVLGKGGFGTVYHGYLGNTQVAVKLLSPSSLQGYKEFQAEVKLLLRVHHRNLVCLVGYCNEGTNTGLIYEYMANGNLEDYLSVTNPNILNWEGRLQIALEAAQGLEYLHNGCKPPIVHRDVKTTNILLNEKFQAKLADFGLSRTFPVEGGTHVSTVVAGTPGYLDPEYYITNWLTEKSDVYSFGIVLLEIITSRPVITRNQEKTHISQWVISKLETGDVKSIVDARLEGDFDVNTIWKVAELAVACVSTTSTRRPNMNQVVVELQECLAMETARNREGNSYLSGGSVEMMSLNIHTGTSPLVR